MDPQLSPALWLRRASAQTAPGWDSWDLKVEKLGLGAAPTAQAPSI